MGFDLPWDSSNEQEFRIASSIKFIFGRLRSRSFVFAAWSIRAEVGTKAQDGGGTCNQDGISLVLIEKH